MHHKIYFTIVQVEENVHFKKLWHSKHRQPATMNSLINLFFTVKKKTYGIPLPGLLICRLEIVCIFSDALLVIKSEHMKAVKYLVFVLVIEGGWPKNVYVY